MDSGHSLKTNDAIANVLLLPITGFDLSRDPADTELDIDSPNRRGPDVVMVTQKVTIGNAFNIINNITHLARPTDK